MLVCWLSIILNINFHRISFYYFNITLIFSILFFDQFTDCSNNVQVTWKISSIVDLIMYQLFLRGNALYFVSTYLFIRGISTNRNAKTNPVSRSLSINLLPNTSPNWKNIIFNNDFFSCWIKSRIIQNRNGWIWKIILSATKKCMLIFFDFNCLFY